MRAAPLVLLGLAAYGVFAAATVPARFVAARVEAETKGLVKLTDAQGSLWSGSARALLTPPQGAPIPAERLAWRFNPWRLLGAELSFATEVEAAGFAGDVEAGRSLGAWNLRQLQLRGDAAGLARLVPIAGTLQPQGALTITAPRLAWDGRKLTGDATLEWQDAIVSLSDVRPLGTYRATLQADGPARVLLSTVAGPLRLNAQGTFTAPATLVLDGEARAEGPQAARLDPLLQLIGPKRPDGAATIAWRTR